MKKKYSFKNLIISFMFFLFIILLIIYPKSAFDSALRGVHLWGGIVLPSLFPFFVASEVLNTTGITRVLGILLEPVMRPFFNVPGCGSFPFALGVTSGYPVGAKITASLYQQGLLSRTEAERLLAFSNNSGPLFITGAVAVGMLKLPEAGMLLLLCHILACITVGFIFRKYKSGVIKTATISENGVINRFRMESIVFSRKKIQSIGIILGDAVRNSILTLLSIGGFIVFFSVLIRLLLDTGVISTIAGIMSVVFYNTGIGKEIFTSLLCGIFEITTGTYLSAEATAAGLTQQLTVISLIIGWAGFSVHSQVISIISGTGISCKPYLVGKALQGIIAAAYTFFALKIAGDLTIRPVPAYSNYISQSWQLNLQILKSLELLLTAFMILSLAASICFTFFHFLKLFRKFL